MLCVVVFFKQKTAYEMRISDWSSDVCSSDLLRAAAEPTRLRILALCAHAELSVTELVTILGQSQPRVSRHLKLMVEAGVLERNREGARAFYRPAERGALAELVRALVALVPADRTSTRLHSSH